MRLLKNYGLSIALIILFLICLIGMAISGYAESNQEKQQKNEPTVSFGQYLTSGDFAEPLFVNWESEFLQQFAYVVLTIFLFQKGSSESKKLDGSDPVDERPEPHAHDPHAPWPVRAGGLALLLYRNSLSLAFAALFILSFVLHGVGGLAAYNESQVRHGQSAVSLVQFLGTARFWSQSFQNWQSEFLSVFAIVTMGIFLRQYGSPESKPVHAPHSETGH
ncbi:hypothetical protein F8S13_18440 [Chloroflexia bacterium SDU3-3]|nr:hypothetical protein F8S13_18440 [Chloroflexia bacterium SDU3-3]